MTAPTSGKPERQITLSVELTVPELSALSKATVVVLSAMELSVNNAAERALKKIWWAARKHPDLP